MSDFRDRLILILQTTGQLEGRADDVADAIIGEFGFAESEKGTYVLGSMDSKTD